MHRGDRALHLYASAKQPLTINGIHLNERGDKAVAEIIDGALFGKRKQDFDPAHLEKLRAAVNDKNFYWFERYRTVDGYSIFGDRADLKFTDGQTNRVVAQREMEVLDVMTANRDKVVWAAAPGREVKADDSNTPDFIPVKTNKPGEGAGGAHIYLSGEGALKKMTPGKDLRINLFADESMFPDLEKPVQMSFYPQGRLWVLVLPSSPHWKPREEMNDKILIFEDTSGTGKADNMTVWADRLHCPTGCV